MGDFGDLSDLDIAMYRAILGRNGQNVADVARALSKMPEDLDKSVAQLSEMGLLRVDGETLTAVSPMLAEATVLGAEDLDLDARRAALEQRRDAIRRFVPDWNDALKATVRDQ